MHHNSSQLSHFGRQTNNHSNTCQISNLVKSISQPIYFHLDPSADSDMRPLNINADCQVAIKDINKSRNPTDLKSVQRHEKRADKTKWKRSVEYEQRNSGRDYINRKGNCIPARIVKGRFLKSYRLHCQESFSDNTKPRNISTVFGNWIQNETIWFHEFHGRQGNSNFLQQRSSIKAGD